jgi:flavin reductase
MSALLQNWDFRLFPSGANTPHLGIHFFAERSTLLKYVCDGDMALDMPVGQPKPSDAAETGELFRRAMRYCGSTVTIITTQHERRYGMVATAVMSVALEPPTLAVCINGGATIHDPLLARRSFSVNILSDADEMISKRFSLASGEARFKEGNWIECDAAGFEGIPILGSAQSVMMCRVQQLVPSGTHTLILASVERVQQRPGSPLLYCDGQYGSFEVQERTAPTGLDDRLAHCA